MLGNRRFILSFKMCSIFLIAVIFLILLIFGPILKIISIYPGDTENTQNRFYLLSSIAQSLAAILALVVSITLITVQMAAQSFTPHIMRLKLKDYFFWITVALYTLTILMALWGKGWLLWLINNPGLDKIVMEICLILTLICLLLLIPYIHDSINSLRPSVFVKKLLMKEDISTVEEVLQRAVNDGLITIVQEVAALIDDYTKHKSKKLNKSRVSICNIPEIADCYRKAAKRAYRKNEKDAFYIIFSHIKELALCIELDSKAGSEFFNSTLTELYDFAQEEEGDSEIITADLAKLHMEAAESFEYIEENRTLDRSEKNLKRALDGYQKALLYFTLEKDWFLYSEIKSNIGRIYIKMARIRKKDNLLLAISTFEESLKIKSNNNSSTKDYALIQKYLGITYVGMASIGENKEENLKKAIDYYLDALNIISTNDTFDNDKEEYASIKTNLGHAYTELSDIENKKNNLSLAITVCRDALQIRKKEYYAKEFATTTNYLGSAYVKLADIEEKEKNLLKAINSYKEALEIRKNDDNNIEYADILNNIGIAYNKLSDIKEKDINLNLALSAYDKALEIYKGKFPIHYAKTTLNFADALEKQGELKKAQKYKNDALKILEME